MKIPILILVPAMLLSGCSMAPPYARTAPPVPASFPTGAAYEVPQASVVAGLPWIQLVQDAKLRTIIARALADNRDLRATLAAVDSARAQYRVERSAQFPTLAATADATIQRRNGERQESYGADIGISAFEIDLFGRVRSQTRSALESYLATQEGARAARISLVAETATAYATLAADQDLLALSRETLASARRTLDLNRSLNAAGLAGKLDVHQAETIVEQAGADVAAYVTQVAQDRNAIELLAGAPVEDALLPLSLESLMPGIASVPAGLSSDILLQRPDVLQAEHQLKAANADIGAARAAMFPRISLTAAIGVASSALSALFDGGSSLWSAAPSASLPIFGGANRANLDYSKAERDRYLAQYEGAIQTAFREVSDALAREGTIEGQQAAQRRLVTASRNAYDLADQRYRAGIDTFLATLTSQRSLYAARRSAIATDLALISNRITLYRVIAADQ
ncbi:multidrug efflux system outer membrane protein [Sphingobium sp. OAS761]|uniref:efflux transporter outer membrane subunit n=1 Tax=Sphingobium sp. OAS761 TaxID=2817901 RepID=UPI0020A23306|nr:efflux transporter outer membrane subunit [Sphingobium sp. OAS761]MCP1470256.1 multidrug efflux system outer membrane protein [Sphingobium sp. OAS761]